MYQYYLRWETRCKYPKKRTWKQPICKFNYDNLKTLNSIFYCWKVLLVVVAITFSTHLNKTPQNLKGQKANFTRHTQWWFAKSELYQDWTKCLPFSNTISPRLREFIPLPWQAKYPLSDSACEICGPKSVNHGHILLVYGSKYDTKKSVTSATHGNTFWNKYVPDECMANPYCCK